jgi:hypothetical protein
LPAQTGSLRGSVCSVNSLASMVVGHILGTLTVNWSQWSFSLGHTRWTMVERARFASPCWQVARSGRAGRWASSHRIEIGLNFILLDRHSICRPNLSSSTQLVERQQFSYRFSGLRPRVLALPVSPGRRPMQAVGGQVNTPRRAGRRLKLTTLHLPPAVSCVRSSLPSTALLRTYMLAKVSPHW